MEALRERSRGRYKILEQLGEGSMGTVYLARDLERDRDVALKALADAGSLAEADLERVRRLFLHEASASSLLSHPGVVRVYDLVDEPDSPDVFLVMEYVDGTNLAEMLSRPNPMPFDFVVKAVSAIADVLDHAHANGVVHRDVKPANILISAGGDIRVTDFGIADLRGEDLAGELQRAGSPNYMAPERVLSTGCDYRSDIWALGVVLYEMLTRRLPFQGESVAELVTKIAAEEPMPLDAHGIAVIPGLQPTVEKALAKEPEDRFQFAGEIAEELEAIQVGQLSLSETLPATSIPMIESHALADPEVDPSARPNEPPAERVGRGWWAAVATASSVLFLLTLSVAGEIGSAQPAEPSAAEGAGSDDALQRQRFEYLALLEEARGLLDRGENEAAAALFAQAEGISPDARRIRALREEARREAEQEVAREVDIEVAGLFGIAEVDFQAGALLDAADAVQRALELDPEHPRSLTLQVAIEQARRDAERRAERRRQIAVAPPARATPEPQPPAPEPMRIEQPIRPPAAAPVPTYSDLKVDFYSELPRGVVTVYLGDSQVLRRPFRFQEKKGFLRSKGVSGGFDDQVRVSAGPSDLRVYLSLPGRETQVHRLSGILPPGAIRALQVRVAADGVLEVVLH